MNAEQLKGLIQAISERLSAHEAELNALDAALGDGDHGTGISTAFRHAAEGVASAQNPAEVLRLTAASLMNRMGGSSGALYGTLFLRASASLQDVITIDLAAFAALWEAGLEGVKARGKAAEGDKTMLDALVPAAAAFRAAPDLASAFEAAAQAAREGAEKTKEMIAKHGRAKYTGERSLGHVDAGAASVALMFEAMRDYWQEFNSNSESGAQ